MSISVRVITPRPRPSWSRRRLTRRPIAQFCLCPGCYYPAETLCDRCTYEGCTNERNRHA